MGEKSFAEMYPALFRLSRYKDKSVLDFVEISSESDGFFLNWNFHFPRNLNNREFPLMAKMLMILHGVRLDTVADDR